MSMGIGGSAEILSENENEIIYQYYNYDLSVIEHRNDQKIMDGRIIINKNKISAEENDVALLLEQEIISILNSKNSWCIIGEKYDRIALSLVRKIMKHYEQEKSFSEKIGYHV